MNGFEKLGEKIKYYREKRGLSLEVLAKDCQISKSRFEEIENGETVYQFSTLIRIANVLGVDLPELLDF